MKAYLSFIVPAHNEEANLVPCIRAIQLACQSFEWTYEIVVAADACSDATAAVAGRLGAKALEVEHRHIAATRNRCRDTHQDIPQPEPHCMSIGDLLMHHLHETCPGEFAKGKVRCSIC